MLESLRATMDREVAMSGVEVITLNPTDRPLALPPPTPVVGPVTVGGDWRVSSRRRRLLLLLLPREAAEAEYAATPTTLNALRLNRCCWEVVSNPSEPTMVSVVVLPTLPAVFMGSSAVMAVKSPVESTM